MIHADNYRDYPSDEQGAHEQSAMPKEGQGHYWDEQASMSRSIEKNIAINDKNLLVHERNNLNANQEQRPDSANPERNRDK